MGFFTVDEPVPLRPDPDPGSVALATIVPGDRIGDPLRLGDWAKVNVVDAEGETKTGWLPAAALCEVVGETVRLFSEPLGDAFIVVNGRIETLMELANWRKVRVTAGADIRVGWIDTTETVQVPSGSDGSENAVVDVGDTLSLGVNEIFRAALFKAEEITRIDAAALAALIDAEAAKVSHGPDTGRWNPRSFNAASNAAGLTQFIPGTWLERARNARTLLNKVAKQKGFVTALDGVAAARERDLLELRFDPELSIVTAAEFGIDNLAAIEAADLLPEGIGDDDRARYMYLAHHEGAAGARLFLRNQNSGSFDKFVAQVGREKASALVAADGGDVALAYRRWLNGYMDEKIQPVKFRRAATGVVTLVATTTLALSKVDGPAIPLARIGERRDLVLEIQEVLGRLGYLDPPADGKWGPVSSWALAEFCAANGLPLAGGFDRAVARSLISPDRLLPDLKPRGDWFDKVITYMNRQGHWICRHPKAVNIVYLEGMDADGRANDDRPNVFNDLRLVFAVGADGRPAIIDSWEGTTEPGRFWTISPMNPNGAARIKFGQYKAWSVGMHHPGRASAHEALRQVEPITVHRDLDKDFKRTGDRTFTGLFDINQHWGYDAPKDDLGNTSAGCLVGRTKSGHRTFMSIVKADPRHLASPPYRFVTTVMPADEVLA